MNDFNLNSLSPEMQADLLRMTQNLIKFAYADMVASGYDPRAVMNWLRITRQNSIEGMLHDPGCELIFN